jgi:hypothetical protein
MDKLISLPYQILINPYRNIMYFYNWCNSFSGNSIHSMFRMQSFWKIMTLQVKHGMYYNIWFTLLINNNMHCQVVNLIYSACFNSNHTFMHDIKPWMLSYLSSNRSSCPQLVVHELSISDYIYSKCLYNYSKIWSSHYER